MNEIGAISAMGAATNFYRMNGQNFQEELLNWVLKDGERCQAVGEYLKIAQDIKRHRSWKDMMCSRNWQAQCTLNTNCTNMLFLFYSLSIALRHTIGITRYISGSKEIAVVSLSHLASIQAEEEWQEETGLGIFQEDKQVMPW